MILEQPRQTGNRRSGQGPGPVVQRCVVVAHEDVNVGLGPGPKRGGGVRGRFAQRHSLVEHDEIRTVTPTLFQRLRQRLLLLRAQAASHRVELEHEKVVVTAEFDHHLPSRAFLLGGRTEAVRPQPDA